MDLDLDEKFTAVVDARIAAAVAAAVATERENWRGALAVLVRTMRLEEQVHLEATRKVLNAEVAALVGTLTELRHAVAGLAKGDITLDGAALNAAFGAAKKSLN
jgi:hypothetical protein